MDRTAFDVLSELTDKQHLIDPVAEQLRLRLNELIDKYQLDHTSVIAVMARLSAAYVHQLQNAAPPAVGRDFIENSYYELFQAFLAMHEDYDNYVQEEAEKEKRIEKN